MFGVVALMLALKHSILPLLAVIALIPVKKSIASGDVETLLWVLAGLSMNPKAFITFWNCANGSGRFKLCNKKENA